MTTGFTPEQTRAILFRDGEKCSMCGRRARTANHRANRGAGGYRAANVLSNGCAICDECNGRIESEGPLAEIARQRGVKVSRYADPRAVPYLSPLYACMVLLDDDGGFTFDDAPTPDPAQLPDMAAPPEPKPGGRVPKPFRECHPTRGTDDMLPDDPDTRAGGA